MMSTIPKAAILALAALLAVSAGAAAQKSKPKTGSVLPGGDSNKPVNIEAVKLDYFDKERKLVYTGNVVAVQGESTLKSSVLTIFLAPKPASGDAAPAAGGQSSTNQVQRMIAKGPVTLLQRDQIGTGDNGVYDKLQNTVILTGNVTLSQGPNVTKGDKLVYDLKSGQAVVTGKRVSSMFIPESQKEGAPAADPAPAAAPPPKKSKSRRSGV